MKTRTKKHETDAKFGREITALSKLNNKDDIQIQFEGMKIIASYKHTYKAHTQEAIKIHVNHEHVGHYFPSLELQQLGNPCWTFSKIQ